MVMADGYVASHLGHRRGEIYDDRMRADWRLQYATDRESVVLQKLVHSRFECLKPEALDFACGTGRVTSSLVQYCRQVVGAEVSPDMLEVAQAKLPNVEFLLGNVLTDDLLHGRRFDIITAFRFFSNAEDGLRRRAFARLAAHLKPGGVLVFNVHQNSDAPGMRLANKWARVRGLAPVRTLCLAEVKKLLHGAGLQLLEVHAVGLFLPPSPRVRTGRWLCTSLDYISDLGLLPATRSESPIFVVGRQARS
jgi:SAM-dependent methyltransferase